MGEGVEKDLRSQNDYVGVGEVELVHPFGAVPEIDAHLAAEGLYLESGKLSDRIGLLVDQRNGWDHKYRDL